MQLASLTVFHYLGALLLYSIAHLKIIIRPFIKQKYLVYAGV